MSPYCWADSYCVLCVAVAAIPECSTTGAGTISMEKMGLALPHRGWCCLCAFALPKSSVATSQCCCDLKGCLGQPESGHQERSYISFEWHFWSKRFGSHFIPSFYIPLTVCTSDSSSLAKLWVGYWFLSSSLWLSDALEEMCKRSSGDATH